jgi:hypothetical protein
VCLGLYDPYHSYTLDSFPCHGSDTGNSTGKYGWPRDGGATEIGTDIGHAASIGQDANAPLPGEQKDGHVDILACFNEKMSDSANVLEAALMAPLYAVQCAFLWAVTPPKTMTSELVDHQTALWNKTQLGATINGIDFFRLHY